METTPDNITNDEEEYMGRVAECISLSVASCFHMFVNIKDNIIASLIKLASLSASNKYTQIFSGAVNDIRRVARYFSLSGHENEFLELSKTVFTMPSLTVASDIQLDQPEHCFDSTAILFKEQYLAELGPIFD